jgi:hypothetical protein
MRVIIIIINKGGDIMVTESFAIVRSGEKIAYLNVYQHGCHGVSLLFDDEFITFRYVDYVTLEKLIEEQNLKYKSLKLIVNDDVFDDINTSIKKELLTKELNIVVEEEKIVIKNDEFGVDSSNSGWFRDVYLYYTDDFVKNELKAWEEELSCRL